MMKPAFTCYFAKFLLILLCIFLSPFYTSASTMLYINTESGWNEFDFGVVNSYWDQMFSFSLTQTSVLRITDVYFTGDQFLVLNRGEIIGATSTPVATAYYTADTEYAFVSDLWSSGEWILPPGDYLISGSVLASPYGYGTGYLRVDSMPVPVPTGFFLLGTSLLGIFWARSKNIY